MQTPEVHPPKDSLILRRLYKALFRRPVFKLFCVLISFIIWCVVIASDPTVTLEKSFSDVSVSVVGQDALRSRGLTVMENLNSSSFNVKLRVSVTQNNYDRATIGSFSPRLDLSTITGTGTQRVYFTAGFSTYGDVIAFEPAYVDVEVESYISRSRIPVVVDYAGKSAEKLWIASAVTEPSQVTISGPKSLVDQVRRAVVTLPMEVLSSSMPQDSVNAIIELQDGAGNIIESPMLGISTESVSIDSARIDVEIYPIREIPVSVSSAVIGTPAHGYQLGGIVISPQTVAVAADAQTLDALDSLYITSPVNIDGLSTSVTADATLGTVSGSRYIALQSVSVQANIVPAQHIHTYVELPVSVYGLPSTLSGVLSHNQMSVVLRGSYAEVADLKSENIHLYVDATGLPEGVHTVPVLCLVDGTDSFTYQAEIPQVELTISAAGN